MDGAEQTVGGNAAGPARTYVLNDNDLIPLFGIVISVVGVLSCVSGGYTCLILPFVGMALGIVGWIQANRAVDPERARTLSVISVVSMAVVLFLVVCLILAYFALIAGSIFIPLILGTS